MQNRLNKELAELSANPPENCRVGIVDNDISKWRVDITGPPGTPYEGGNFVLSIELPAQYPFKPPEAKFETKIYHPNVLKDSGEICKDMYQTGWGPVKNLRWVIELILSFLINPVPEHSVEAEISRQMIEDPNGYAAAARQWVQQYAR
jgi:ubiquitin-conjugating enzyme (huntingtin interacting protein 2)